MVDETPSPSLTVVEKKPVWRSVKKAENPAKESVIPKDITSSILKEATFPLPLPKLDSMMVEDFVVDILSHGITTIEEIQTQYATEGVSQRVKKMLEGVEERAHSINWSTVLGDGQIAQLKQRMCSHMQELGVVSDVVTAFEKLDVELWDSHGVSRGGEAVGVSIQQIVRKAIDFQKVFPDLPFDSILHALAVSTTAHELGHAIDYILGNVSKNVPFEWRQGNSDENGIERRDERFAEYWGRQSLVGDEQAQAINHQQWVMNVAAVDSMWGKVSVLPGMNMGIVLKTLSVKERGLNNDVSEYLNARAALYGGNEPENYARPYTTDQIKAAMIN